MLILRVQHVSPLGPSYMRVHVVVPRGVESLAEAVRHTGATAPAGAPDPVVVPACPCSEIVYADRVCPVAIDPRGIVVLLVGCSVYVDVPYKCTIERLERHVIPAKLRSIGVGRFGWNGALARADGIAARASDIWGDGIAMLWWTKLRMRVSHCYRPRTVAAITRLQQAVRRRQEEYELV